MSSFQYDYCICKGCSMTNEAINDAVDHLLDYLHQNVRFSNRINREICIEILD